MAFGRRFEETRGYDLLKRLAVVEFPDLEWQAWPMTKTDTSGPPAGSSRES